MNLYNSADLREAELRKLCIRPWSVDITVQGRVAEICLDVKRRGDEALREYSRRFDSAAVTEFRVSHVELLSAQRGFSGSLRDAVDHAAKNIRSFHSAQLQKEAIVETEPGVVCWREQRAIESVGLYAPAGSAPLPSTVLMLGIPALLAGCSHIILCSPPQPNGTIDPAVLATAAYLGIKEVYKIGGAQAIAAMAYGTQSVPKVDKIFGPGNQYVTEAKRYVSNDPDGAAVDLLAGPSELLIIADETADPVLLAADLLSQAEHDPQSQVVLATTDAASAEAAIAAVMQQLQTLSRSAVATRALDNSFVIIFPSMDDAISFANLYGPEHLLINAREPEQLLQKIHNAGSVFLGPFAPVTAGDYASGTNHTLPTGGTVRWTSGISVDSFRKSMTVQRLTRDGLTQLAPTLLTLATTEGLDAHAAAVSRRLGDKKTL